MKMHPILIGDCNALIGEYLRQNDYSKVLILVDENTKTHCLPLLKIDKNTEIHVIQAGETSKNIMTIEETLTSMMDRHLDRYSLLINLGGGVITDIGGLAGSLFMRGIDFLHIPTTLLGMVDAAIGGKCGVNLRVQEDEAFAKNIVGLFSMPKQVFIDLHFLETLPSVELTSGWAEVIKHGIILGGELWDRLIEGDLQMDSLGEEDMRQITYVKESIVRDDFKEGDKRKYLNLGHTFGHALESVFNAEGNTISHGHAVAVGMVWELLLSRKLELIGDEELDHIVTYIKQYFKMISLYEQEFKDILFHMRRDKKKRGNNLQFALCKGVGDVTLYENRDDGILKDVHKSYIKKYAI